jgi:hypothetical protein
VTPFWQPVIADTDNRANAMQAIFGPRLNPRAAIGLLMVPILDTTIAPFSGIGEMFHCPEPCDLGQVCLLL